MCAVLGGEDERIVVDHAYGSRYIAVPCVHCPGELPDTLSGVDVYVEVVLEVRVAAGKVVQDRIYEARFFK